jgi:hypothetical protein
MNEQTFQSTQESFDIYHTAPRRDPMQDLTEYFRDYARENPGAVALWCLGIGFVLGWKLKPW